MLGFAINRVIDTSMSPELAVNRYVLLRNFGSKKQLKKGQIVKVQHSTYGPIIKRIVYQDKNGLYWLEGDKPERISTCQIGPVSAAQITGVLICTI